MKTPEQTNPTAYSDRIMSTLYSTKVTATGGRHGHIRSEDGLLDMKLALPRELGGKGDATNPETLFAGGYAACFENALLRVSREKGLRFADGDVEVIAEIGLSRNDSGNFVLSAARAGQEHRGGARRLRRRLGLETGLLHSGQRRIQRRRCPGVADLAGGGCRRD